MSTRPRKRTRPKQNWVKHLQRAQARGVSLARYCRERNMSVQSLYTARYQSLKRRRPSAATKKPKSIGKFVQVQIAPTDPVAASLAYRVSVKGCVIECATLPPTSWLTSLMSGESDVVP